MKPRAGTEADNAALGDDLLARAQDFFSQPLELKNCVAFDDSPHWRGYAATGDEVTASNRDMREQLDLSMEAEHMKHFKEDFKDDPNVDFADPIDGMVTRNALVETFCEGVPITQFMKETVEKVKELRKKIDDKKLKVQIEIDGGINFETSKIAIKAGVDILVSGTTVFKEYGGDLKKNIQLLKTG